MVSLSQAKELIAKIVKNPDDFTKISE